VWLTLQQPARAFYLYLTGAQTQSVLARRRLGRRLAATAYRGASLAYTVCVATASMLQQHHLRQLCRKQGAQAQLAVLRSALAL
jgi:hypothetical protein